MQKTCEDGLFEIVNPVVQGLGYTIVELTSKHIKTGLFVHLVIYAHENVGIEECVAVSKAVIPRIEMSEDSRDVQLEVSSPGIDRNFKSTEEFSVFSGRGVRILLEHEWLGGIIHDTDASGVHIQIEGETKFFPFESIRKAKLDYSLEVQ